MLMPKLTHIMVMWPTLFLFAKPSLKGNVTKFQFKLLATSPDRCV